MKVLLFTHKSDIDGMGGAVLARLAFEEVEYILTETFNLQNEIKKYYETGEIYNYDFIYVTDLWLEEPMLSKVANDEKLKGKFFVFDHHKSALVKDFNKYSFTTIRVSDENGLCSGTSLFYEYLTKIGILNSDCKMIKEFSELTRKYDTWEWKTKFHDEMPHKLTLLFDSIGCDNYIEFMFKKLHGSEEIPFFFNEIETLLIQN